jgi:phage terminase small subunit
MGPALEALTGRQREFAIFMASGELSGAEAARKAGYSHKAARQQAQRMLTNDDIVAAINEMKEAAVDEAIMDRHEALKALTDIVRDETQNTHTTIKAIDSLSKMQGWNAPDKVDNTHTVRELPKIIFEDMTDDEDE